MRNWAALFFGVQWRFCLNWIDLYLPWILFSAKILFSLMQNFDQREFFVFYEFNLHFTKLNLNALILNLVWILISPNSFIILHMKPNYIPNSLNSPKKPHSTQKKTKSHFLQIGNFLKLRGIRQTSIGEDFTFRRYFWLFRETKKPPKII
jgi:hypothetical protein